jgi:hypothetical protein
VEGMVVGAQAVRTARAQQDTVFSGACGENLNPASTGRRAGPENAIRVMFGIS